MVSWPVLARIRSNIGSRWGGIPGRVADPYGHDHLVVFMGGLHGPSLGDCGPGSSRLRLGGWGLSVSWSVDLMGPRCRVPSGGEAAGNDRGTLCRERGSAGQGPAGHIALARQRLLKFCHSPPRSHPPISDRFGWILGGTGRANPLGISRGDRIRICDLLFPRPFKWGPLIACRNWLARRPGPQRHVHGGFHRRGVDPKGRCPGLSPGLPGRHLQVPGELQGHP